MLIYNNVNLYLHNYYLKFEIFLKLTLKSGLRKCVTLIDNYHTNRTLSVQKYDTKINNILLSYDIDITFKNIT